MTKENKPKKYSDLTRKQLIKLVKEATGQDKTLTWFQLCQLTEFDDFATMFVFGINWNTNCKDNVIENMTTQYLKIILYNVLHFPKKKKTRSMTDGLKDALTIKEKV